jgi:hypothetical protein
MARSRVSSAAADRFFRITHPYLVGTFTSSSSKSTGRKPSMISVLRLFLVKSRQARKQHSIG